MTSLPHEITGSGEPLVLVHGSFADQGRWALAAPIFAQSRRVVAYSRRWHGAGAPPQVDVVTRREHEDDLAELIEGLDAGPVHVASYSYGGAVALGLASRRPELFKSLAAQEPGLFDIASGHPAVQRGVSAMLAAAERIASGDEEGGTRVFVEQVALGPGAWDAMPPEFRGLMVRNARSFVADANAPGWGSIDLDALGRLDVPVLLTQGSVSPPIFAPVTRKLVQTLRNVRLVTIEGASHSPHGTHPKEYAAAVLDFQNRLAHERQAALVG